MPAQTVIKLRRDTSANWETVNPVLASGEPGIETDTNKIKIGDGTSAWDELSYSSGGGGVEISDTAPEDTEATPLWWDTESATLYIYYDGFWIEAVVGKVGPQGPAGADGVDGEAATIDVGTVTTGDAGTSVSVVNSGTTSAAIFDFTIPKGDKGDTGDTGPAGEYIPALQTISGATYTVLEADKQNSLVFTNADPVVTIATSTAFAPGDRIDIVRDGADGLTITAGSGVTFKGKGDTATSFTIDEQFEAASVLCVGSNAYRVIGAVSAV